MRGKHLFDLQARDACLLWSSIDARIWRSVVWSVTRTLPIGARRIVDHSPAPSDWAWARSVLKLARSEGLSPNWRISPPAFAPVIAPFYTYFGVFLRSPTACK